MTTTNELYMQAIELLSNQRFEIRQAERTLEWAESVCASHMDVYTTRFNEASVAFCAKRDMIAELFDKDVDEVLFDLNHFEEDENE